MAKKRIENKDILAPDLLVDVIAKGKQLLEVIALQEAALDKILKSNKAVIANNPFKDSKDVKEYNAATAEVNQTIEQQNKTNAAKKQIITEVEKAEKKLKDLQKEEAVVVAELNLKIAEQRKENKLRAEQALIASKTSKELAKDYATESKRLTLLRKEYKDLAVQNKTNTQEARELLSTINSLDSELKEIDKTVGENFRTVGSYTDSIKEAYKELKEQEEQLAKNRKELVKLQKETKEGSDEWNFYATQINKVETQIGQLNVDIKKSETTINNYSDGIGEATQTLLALGAAAAGLSLGIDGLKDSINQNEEAGKDFNKVQSQVAAGADVVKNRIGQAASGIFDLVKQTITGQGTMAGLFAAMGKVTGATDNITDAIFNAADAAGVAADKTFELDRAMLEYETTLAIVNAEIEKQNAIAGDSTKSFDEIAEAIKRSSAENVKKAALEFKIASERKSIIETELNALEDNQAKLAKQTELTEANIELIEKESELTLALIENKKALQEVERDRFERELDYAIDAFDSSKTLNERLIGSDRTTLEEKKKLFLETVKLADSSFQSQVDLLEGYVGKKLALDDLVKESDERVVRERVRAFGADDIVLGRILEVYRERRTILQDLNDLEDEVSDQFKEREQEKADFLQELQQARFEGEIAGLERSLSAQEDAISKSVSAFNEAIAKANTIADTETVLNSLNTQIDVAAAAQRQALNELFDKKREALEQQANYELNLEDTTAEQKLVIQQELQNELDALEAERLNKLEDSAEKQKEIAEKAAETQKKIAADLLKKDIERVESFVNAFFDSRDRILEKEIEANDREIQNAQSSLETQRALAAQGIDAQVGYEEKRLAEAELKKEELAKEQERREKRRAYFAIVAEEAKNGGSGAAFRAFAELLVADTLAGAFFDGTEAVGRENNRVIYDRGTSKDNLLAWVHPDERIIPSADNSVIGFDTPNDDLVRVFKDFKDGRLSYFNPDYVEKPTPVMGAGVERELRKITRNTEKAATSGHLDRLGKWVETQYNNGIKSQKRGAKRHLGK